MALHKEAHPHRGRNVLNAGEVDDGIGSSDDEIASSAFNSNSNKTGDVEPNKSIATNMLSTVSHPSVPSSRKVIHLDMSAVNRLLAFDEEEDEADDDLEEEKSNRKSSQNSWRKTAVKDLASLSVPQPVQRRHSISTCNMPLSARLNSDHGTKRENQPMAPVEETLPEYRLNLREMHSALKSEFRHNAAISGSGPTKQSPNMRNLRLDEVSHIRVVSSKAALHTRTISVKMRDEVERGKLCFVCMKTSFGFFSRGSKCEMCKQTVCHKCYTKMPIPLEDFTTTPIFAPSPNAEPVPHAGKGLFGHAKTSADISKGHGLVSLQVPGASVKKFSLPDHAGLFREPNSVGSAPSSPKLQQRAWPQQAGGLSTISGSLVSTRVVPGSAQPMPMHNFGPVSLPPQQLHSSQYATIPKQVVGRRMSLAAGSNVDLQREKLKGSLLAVCMECKDMVLQVIRSSRTTRRMQTMRSMVMGLASSSPEKVSTQKMS